MDKICQKFFDLNGCYEINNFELRIENKNDQIILIF